MIYISGDIHRKVFCVENAIKKLNIKTKDLIVLLGDVNINYFGNDHGDRYEKFTLNKLGVPTLCVHGNHEQRPDTIESYHEIEWHGGIVYVEDIYPNLLFTKDGEVYNLDGQKAIAIGGAYSVDKEYRLRNGMPWFPDEQPSAEVKARVEKKLDELEWKVDVVLSHTCPKKYILTEALLPGIDQSAVDRSTEEWLGRIEEKLDYKAWFCGHWHVNKRIDKMHFLYDEYERLTQK